MSVVSCVRGYAPNHPVSVVDGRTGLLVSSHECGQSPRLYFLPRYVTRSLSIITCGGLLSEIKEFLLLVVLNTVELVPTHLNISRFIITLKDTTFAFHE